MTRKLFENTSLLSEIPLFKKMMETAMNFTVISGLNIPMNRTKTHEVRNDRDLNTVLYLVHMYISQIECSFLNMIVVLQTYYNGA